MNVGDSLWNAPIPPRATMEDIFADVASKRPPRKKQKIARTCVICIGDIDIRTPCPSCLGLYCSSCLQDMFTAAVKDQTRFPVRCCGLIQIHHVLPELDTGVAKAYRVAFENWMTAKKLYCPKPTCSAFIPERLIPASKKLLPDTSTPLAGTVHDTFPCPTCKTSICADCHKLDHDSADCSTKQDDEEKAMLAAFGYKQCPRCGEGVRKMYGCTHMLCRCGAHWCWGCLRSAQQCVGRCDDEDEGAEEEDDDEEEEEEGEDFEGDASEQFKEALTESRLMTEKLIEDAKKTGRGLQVRTAADSELITGRLIEDAKKTGLELQAQAAADAGFAMSQRSQSQISDALLNAIVGNHNRTSLAIAADAPSRAPAPMNFDASTQRDWERSGLNFGEHPEEDDTYGQIWSCRHTLNAYEGRDGEDMR
ncbi:unnamed protein product [Zymoseptoria tritici ST99CH_1E4]|uniref:RBR-type E3 ubiquitin transferase n=1 Tax=Zymoseptoria tritici ST99CH_1E4 TaxID=1276532 RepID=A0A2H1GG13_ZYMTR|nr:unnamed protein product [Zymoseptoria tritici ST99CH_1E4]